MKNKEVNKLNFEIMPNLGAGPILFGMEEQEIHKILGNQFEKIKKSMSDGIETDMYEWCFIYYKKPGVCQAIEFFEPAVPLLNGEKLFGRPYSEVKEILIKLDDQVQLDEDGLTSYKLGIGIYAPSSGSNSAAPIEGVIIFGNGYYD